MRLKSVITGGAGFIGSHLADELVRRDHLVTILDDLSTGKEANVGHLLKSSDVEFIEGSVTSLPLLEKAFRASHYVFHLAAISGVPQSIANPQTAHEVNATGTLKVLLAAQRNQVARVIYASSSAVYGDTTTPRQREDMLPNPQSPYAAAKLAGEHYCLVFSQVYALPTACLRYFNVYGPRQDPHSEYAAVIPQFVRVVSRRNPPVIFGNGEQTRDFTFYKDVVTANVLVAESEATGIFNIGSGESNSINRLAQLVSQLMGQDLKPVYEEPKPGDIKHSLADISRARIFGYQPAYQLEAGLKQTIKELQNAK